MIVIPRLSIQSSSIGTSGISNLSSSIVLFITETGDSDREVKESRIHPSIIAGPGERTCKMSLSSNYYCSFFKKEKTNCTIIKSLTSCL
jgi:hypothetical protein